MKRLFLTTAIVAVTAAACYGTYVVGWYHGLEYHSVVAGMSETRLSLSAARSLRQADPDLALELLDENISWMNQLLRDDKLEIPEQERANLRLVLDNLDRYHAEFAADGNTN
jgi:hypothetical protein